MPEYFLAYHRGKMPENLEEHMGKFMKWVGGRGKAVVMPGMPLGRAKIVSTNGVSADGGAKLIGFSILEADSLEAAVERSGVRSGLGSGLALPHRKRYTLPGLGSGLALPHRKRYTLPWLDPFALNIRVLCIMSRHAGMLGRIFSSMMRIAPRFLRSTPRSVSGIIGAVMPIV